MSKTLKTTLNILIFALIAGFGYYMIRSMGADKRTHPGEKRAESTFVSPYKLINTFEFDSDVVCFDVNENFFMLVVLSDKISTFKDGKHQQNFAIETGVRDIVLEKNATFLLYPTKIVSYIYFWGEKKQVFEACSPNSDYVAITTSNDYVFVTDAHNKNIVQYTKQGGLVRFIRSPDGFIIPSHTFDIININDTIYTANSGRHKIESYTLDGKFITLFGKAGAQAGAFAGCCNPVYLAATFSGNILTSEKGNPRISSYGRDGKFRMILFDSHALGGGTNAYRMKVSGEHIYIANRKTILVYALDTTRSEKACNQACGGDGCKRK